MINQVRHSDDRNRSRKLGGNAALLKNCAVPHCVVTSAALDGARQLGKVWNPQSRPSRFRGAVSLDIMCIRQCNAVLASQVLKKKNQILEDAPMDRMTFVILASVSRSRTIDQRGN